MNVNSSYRDKILELRINRAVWRMRAVLNKYVRIDFNKCFHNNNRKYE